MQMAAPRVIIGMNLAMGSDACMDDYACAPYQNSL